MAQERRPLIAGIRPSEVDSSLEKRFVRGEPLDAAQTPSTAKPNPGEGREGKGQPPIGRVPFTTRIRADFAAALKRASLERQLNAQFPNTLQDILEEALEPWLRANHYIP